jgi:hypothetical protein
MNTLRVRAAMLRQAQHKKPAAQTLLKLVSVYHGSQTYNRLMSLEVFSFLEIDLENDLAIIGRKAQSAGIPWQVFISRILHRYAQGDLIERNP